VIASNRWFLLSLFLLSSTINYLDRQVLAGLAPLVKAEFLLNNRQYGWLASAFSIPYALGAPFAGFLIDRLGLTRGVSLVVGVWSLAGVLTGLGTGLASLAACRALLGLAEGGGIPAGGKAVRLLLKPEERALGTGLNQLFISLGLIGAAPLSVAIALRSNWRTAFLVTGGLGFLWIALWRAAAPRSAAVALESAAPPAPVRTLLRDRRAWILAAANALSMVLYSLWTNWAVLYLTEVRGASLGRAAWLSSAPAVLSTLGAFGGGWLSFRLMRGGGAAVPSRLRVCAAASAAALLTALIPWAPGAGWAAAGMGLSFFAVTAFSVNLYAMPLDLFPAGHAALAVSLLTSSYGLMQAGLSVVFGAVIDRFGYTPICVAASFTPLGAYFLLRWTGVGRQQ
jgi:ACS family hexuronate transporter-like MFS transporter